MAEPTRFIEGRAPDGELRTWTIEGERRPAVCEWLQRGADPLYVCLDDATVYTELVDAQARAIALWGSDA